MKILEIKTLRGPNYWSNYRKKLIVMKLDLGALEERPTDKIDGFAERLAQLFPSMLKHRCSKDHEGGFFERVKDGTWMGHVIEHIALEIQTLAGMECGFGRTRGSGTKGMYNVVFSYMEETVGVYAAKASVKIAEALIEGSAYDLDEDIKVMRQMREKERFGPSTGSIVDEAVARDIPFIRLNKESLVNCCRNSCRSRDSYTNAANSNNIWYSSSRSTK